MSTGLTLCVYRTGTVSTGLTLCVYKTDTVCLQRYIAPRENLYNDMYHPMMELYMYYLDGIVYSAQYLDGPVDGSSAMLYLHWAVYGIQHYTAPR